MKVYILVIVIVLIVVGLSLYAMFGSMFFDESNESTENTTDGNAKVDMDPQNTELKDNKPIETHDSDENTSKLNKIMDEAIEEYKKKDEKITQKFEHY